MTTYYEILDLPRSATPEQIRTAYRILVQLHHPDRLRQANAQVRQYAEERLKRINEAYAVLSDPARRKRYDATQPEYNEAPDRPDEASGKHRRRPGRQGAGSTSHTTARAEAREWARQAEQAERDARAQERQRRAKQEAEAERQEAERRAQRVAQDQFPRARCESKYLILHFAPGVWTTLVQIPAGEFLMGADPQCDPEATDNELPLHRVHVSEYYLGKYPVTNAQFDVFVNSGSSHLSANLAHWTLPTGQETHPVVNVTWNDAVAFCQWLSAATGRQFHLPTEAEWEKGARGPAGSPYDRRVYPWGDSWNSAWAALGPNTMPVGHHSPDGDSPYDICDMSGNVWEWCSDRFDAKFYARLWQTIVKDPAGPETGQGNVARGGAFDSAPRHLRCSRRNWFYPDNARLNLGFRLAAAPI